jgi:hypothetical protein
MSNFKKMIIVAGAIMLVQGLLAATVVYAEQQVVDDLDMDQDGFLSLREAAVSRYLLENFYVIDLNEDGLISKEEFSFMLRSNA